MDLIYFLSSGFDQGNLKNHKVLFICSYFRGKVGIPMLLNFSLSTTSMHEVWHDQEFFFAEFWIFLTAFELAKLVYQPVLSHGLES